MKTMNLMSDIMVNGTAEVTPLVGMGATVCFYTDRAACTIVKVTACTITVRGDKTVRTDNNGRSDCQSYSYSPDPNGGVDTFRKTKKGWKNSKGNYLIVGRRDSYYDYSF